MEIIENDKNESELCDFVRKGSGKQQGISYKKLKDVTASLITYCVLNFDWDKKKTMKKLDLTDKQFEAIFK